MGWTSFYDNRELSADAILKKEFDGIGQDGTKWAIVDSATNGSAWYAILECTPVNQSPRYDGIVCLFKRSKRYNEFSFKEISERCGPNADKAPKRIIDKLDALAPIDSNDDGMGAKWAREWRARCRANATAKINATKLTPGLIVRFGGSMAEYELIESAGARRGWYVKLVGGGGMLYRASAKQLSKAIIVSEA